MNTYERLRYRRITFDGWQVPLHVWRHKYGSHSEVPEGTEYLGSFGIRYKGKITGTCFDVYITENGVVEAIISRGGNEWRGKE